MRPSPAVLAVCLLAVPSIVAAQAVGPEFQVNTYTTGYQNVDIFGRSVAIEPSGDFVVTWFNFPGNPSVPNGIFARRYDASGNPKAAPVQVNSYTSGGPLYPSVVSDDTGAFVIVWDHRNGRDGSGGGIFARRYDPAGVAQGPEFQVNSYTTGNQIYPSVAMNGSGSFVIAWESAGQDGSASGIFARRYDAGGVPQGSEFQVNTYTTANQNTPSVAIDSLGDFVVAWDVGGAGGDKDGIAGQRFGANGVKQGSEFGVSQGTGSQKAFPAAAMSPDGSFLVAWDDGSNRDGSDRGIFARRFDSGGVAQGGDFQVNTYTTGLQGIPRAAADVDGGFVVTWIDTAGRDGSAYGAIAQRFDAPGAPNGPEFVVNSYTTGRQTYPTIAVNAGGQAVAVYADINAHDGSSSGVFGQRFLFAPDEIAPAVTVTSPNGGETLHTGSEFPIVWTASDAVGVERIDVEYSTDAGSHWTAIPECTALDGAATACFWNAPAPATTRGRIRVTARDAANNVGSDISNASYEVAGGVSSVTLTIPDAAGLSWQAGTTKMIKWNHNLGKNQFCTLELNRDFPGGSWELITSSAVTKAKTNSTYSWVVPSGATVGATARVRVSWSSDTSIADVSDNGFAITSRVKVAQPNSAANWPSGATRLIKWTHNLGAAASFNVGIDRNGDALCEQSLASNVAASSATAGLYSWQVCGTGPARICVTATGNPLDADVSDVAFNITGAPVACGP